VIRQYTCIHMSEEFLFHYMSNYGKGVLLEITNTLGQLGFTINTSAPLGSLRYPRSALLHSGIYL
jgi:hypothetical protein